MKIYKLSGTLTLNNSVVDCKYFASNILELAKKYIQLKRNCKNVKFQVISTGKRRHRKYKCRYKINVRM